jgi:hypothetical protein
MPSVGITRVGAVLVGGELREIELTVRYEKETYLDGVKRYKETHDITTKLG